MERSAKVFCPHAGSFAELVLLKGRRNAEAQRGSPAAAGNSAPRRRRVGPANNLIEECEITLYWNKDVLIKLFFIKKNNINNFKDFYIQFKLK